MTPGNLLTEWARLLLGTLQRAGVKDVVLSPGSRSTPFAWAAATTPGISCASVIDERSAAFFAVGQAKVSGRPSLLIATSGSAAANYFPAVIESAQAYVPVLVLSADRPFELQAAHAAQTIDQTKLFGDFSRQFFELGMPDADPAALRGLARLAFQAVDLALHPLPGPVHLNARARKPLEPQAANDSPARELSARVDALLASPATTTLRAEPVLGGARLAEIADSVALARRGLLVCGPLPVSTADERDALFELARVSGFVVCVEAASQLRFACPEGERSVCDGFDALFASTAFARRIEPDCVLQLGLPPVSSAWERFVVARPNLTRHVIAAHGWPDPLGGAASIMHVEPPAAARALSRLVARLRDAARDPEAERERAVFRELLAWGNARVWQAVEAELDAGADLSEGHAVRTVVESLPENALLCVGNSLPIRHLDLYCRATDAGIRVWSQRGTNGIDGLISGAAGAASQWRGPTTLLLGDISFLHDLSGLWATRTIRSPLAIVVLHNGGGRIFEQLPLATTAAADETALRHWLTPHELELEHAGPLFGLACSVVRDAASLRSAMARAQRAKGAEIIVVRVPNHAAAASARAIRERLERLLETSGGRV